MNKNRYSNQSGCQHGQRQELAEHTVVHPRRGLRQVAVTAVMQAVGTFCLRNRRNLLMQMKRRDYQHWQKYRQ